MKYLGTYEHNQDIATKDKIVSGGSDALELCIEKITESTSWAVPQAVDNKFKVFAVGGGGGCTQTSDGYPGGGGGGGYVVIKELTLEAGTIIPITCGAGGAGVRQASSETFADVAGGDGGTTTFGTYISAPGGKGAKGNHGGDGGAGGGAGNNSGKGGDATGGISVPNGYTQLQYIQASGTQYIDTCFKPNQDTRVVMDCKASTSRDVSFPFGVRAGLQSKAFAAALTPTQVFYNFASYYTFTNYSDILERITIDANKNVCTFTSSDTGASATITLTSGTFTTDNNLVVGSFVEGASVAIDEYAFYGNIYSAQVYDNGTLIRSFVPCKNPSGEVGMYDTVNNVFYENSGTGVFAAGEETPVLITYGGGGGSNYGYAGGNGGTYGGGGGGGELTGKSQHAGGKGGTYGGDGSAGNQTAGGTAEAGEDGTFAHFSINEMLSLVNNYGYAKGGYKKNTNSSYGQPGNGGGGYGSNGGYGYERGCGGGGGGYGGNGGNGSLQHGGGGGNYGGNGDHGGGGLFCDGADGGGGILPGESALDTRYNVEGNGGSGGCYIVYYKKASDTVDLLNITVTTLPTKISCLSGGNFDTTGMVVKAVYSDGSLVPITDYTYSPTTLTGEGEQTVTISYTKQGITKTTTITVDVMSIKSNFADNKWSVIIAACQNNAVPSTWAVGDNKTMTINSEDYQIDIIGKDHDTYTAGGTAPLTFQIHDCYRVAYPMNTNNTNSGGWTSSVMRTTTLPALLSLMPTEVQQGVKEVNKLTSAGSKSSTINTTADKLFLLSEIEIFGSTSYSKSGEGTQYDYYKAGNSKIKNRSGSANNWWERSPSSGNSTNFCYVNSNGYAIYSYASNSNGVAFGFCF